MVLGFRVREVEPTVDTLHSRRSFRQIGNPDLQVLKIQPSIKSTVADQKTDIGPRSWLFSLKCHF